MFEEFAVSEYQARLDRTRTLLCENGIDALMVTSEMNLRYLAGLADLYWLSAGADHLQVGLIPTDKNAECTLLLPSNISGGSAKSSWIKDVRSWSQYSAGKLPGPIRTIVDTINEKGLNGAVIGVEIGDNSRLGMSISYFEKLKEVLSGCEFVDCSGILEEVQMVKTPAEIEYVRRACEINCQGMKAGLDVIAEGISEVDIAKAIARRWCEITDDFSSNKPWFIMVYSSPYRNQWFDCGPSQYELQKGDYVVMDIGYCYKGYWSDMFRTACIGEPNEKLSKYYHASRQAALAVTEFVKPGIEMSQLSDTAMNTWLSLGFKDRVEEAISNDWDCIGHHIGLSIPSSPFLTRKEHRVLEPGMFLAVEPKLKDRMPNALATICVGIEDDILVTDNGYENLTASVSNELFIR